MKAVVYGAGNIGRGFLGQIFSQSGYDLTFIDVDDTVVDRLNKEGRYPIRILSDDTSPGGTDDIWIEGIRAINGKNEEETAQAISVADIMATAVGVRALPLIVPVIAAGLKKRFAQNRRALNIIICENLINADKILSEMIKKQLSCEERKVFDETVGLVETSIGRMVPLQTEEMQDGNPLRVCVEAYGFLPVARTGFKGEIPPLVGVVPSGGTPDDNFDFFIQRKLFVHNLGHGICAYFGLIRGNKYIYEATSHGGLLFIAQNAMLESALALSKRFKMPLADLHYHIRDLLRRFSNRALGDTCARVGADTPRKLSKQDRFIGAFCCCTKEGINPAFISVGTAAALYWHLKEKDLPQSREAALAALREISGLEEADTEMILLFHSLLNSSQSGDFNKSIEKIIKLASDKGNKPGII